MFARYVLGLIFAVAFPGSAAAGDYTDPAGFSLRCPDGWVLFTEQQLKSSDTTIPKEVRDWAIKTDFNWVKTKLIIVRFDRVVYTENVNLVVSNGLIPANENAAQEIAAYFKAELGLKDVAAKVDRVGAREALVFDLSTPAPGSAAIIRQRLYYVPVGSKTYIFTCTAPAQVFDAFESAFGEIVSGFKPPESDERQSDKAGLPPTNVEKASLSVRLRTVIIGTIGGGTLAALVLLVRQLGEKSRRKREELLE